MVIGLKQVRVSSGNLLPSPSTENHLLSLSELADRNKHFSQVREQAVFAIFRKCPLTYVKDCGYFRNWEKFNVYFKR